MRLHWFAPAILITALTASGQAPAGLAGTWEGTLQTRAGKLPVVLNLSQAPDGLYVGAMDFHDRAGKVATERVRLTGNKVRIELKSKAFFEGTLDGARLTGTWTQGRQPLPLELTRTSGAAPPAGSEVAKTPASLPFGLPLILRVPIAPTPIAGDDGRIVLCYELHITNFGNWVSLLKRLEVLGDATTLARFEGADLNNILETIPLGARDDRRTLGPGRSVIAFFWIALKPGARIPASLRHHITVDEHTLDGTPVAIPTAKPVVLGPPLKGSGWRTGRAPGPNVGHGHTVVPVSGVPCFAQRFAIDWVRMGPNGETYSGEFKDNRSFHAYGKELLAVADGVVSALKDGIPENVPGRTSRAVPITLETVGGNYVALDLGGNRFAFYAHLQPGSFKVKLGDRVRKGQVLALLGNSGNSTEPHLHFQVTDGNSTLGSEGLPYVFDSGETVLQWRRVKFR